MTERRPLNGLADAVATNPLPFTMRPCQTPPPVDVAIIGAGPTGLFAAFYAGLRQMSIKIIDSLEMLGGQLTTLYPEKYIYDVAGFPKVLAKQLSDDLALQAMQYQPTVCLGEQVKELQYDPATKIYNLRTSASQHAARTIIIAAGVGAFAPRHWAWRMLRTMRARVCIIS